LVPGDELVAIVPVSEGVGGSAAGCSSGVETLLRGGLDEAEECMRFIGVYERAILKVA
jgi:hypothetical protein